ncbi:MAG: ATP-binding cassette domain-containing protein [Deltaproteobacteria bacterium]|uniref:ATP-binding cassette domain-containing protein n=1 Tax=Candidatus Zymogenus saltonus TaxID=2844893 RepID=A0A9D8KJ27_9DELT|nr:ATP-binding cassette domain-containing protein [Candidatus Zymogenus saltonus]
MGKKKSNTKLPPKKELIDVYKRLIKYVKPYWGKFFPAVFFNLVFAGTTGALVKVVEPLINNLIESKNLKGLLLLSIGVVFINFVRGFANFFGTYLMRAVGLHVIKDIQEELYSHIQGLSLRFFSDHHTGLLTSRINNDVGLVNVAVTDAVEGGFKELVTILVLMGVAFYQDWLLAIVAFGVFPLMTIPITRISRSMRKVSTRGQEKTADITTILMETFSGVRIVKAFGMEDYESERFNKENTKLFKTYLKKARVRAMTGPIMEVIGTFGFALVLLYGGWKAMGIEGYIGKYVSFIAALMLIYPSVRALSRLNNGIQEAIAASIRIFNILDTKPDIVDVPGAIELPPVKNEIEFKNVSFSYDSVPVLTDINLKVKVGEVLAFVGMSGGGKTTLVNLIPRFYDVTGGKVLFDGVDIRDVKLKSLRSQIGIVTQQTILFSDTIRNNIAYGNMDTSQEEIDNAAKAANAYNFIKRLPEGYDTMIGEDGARLSGGERQRLSIARALLKDAPVLILDEATSSLDTESEKEVQKALENLMKGRTTFVIAHRLSTIQHADRIMVVVGGKIVEQGTHDELLAKGGEYKKLYDMQFQDKEVPTDGVVLV